MWHPPVIETERLRLRDLRLADQQDIFEYVKKPIISKYTLWEPHQSIQDTVDYIKDYAEKYYREGTLRSVINHRNRFWDMKYCSLLRNEWKVSKVRNGPYARRAEFGDEEGIHIAHMKSIQEICSKDYTKEQINAWCRKEFNYESRRKLIDEQAIWVVEDSDQIRGYGLLFFDNEKSLAEITALYFTPDVCGKGFGKEILFYMKELAKISGIKEIYLSSTKTAKSFYEAQGFHQYAEDNSCVIGGVAVECHPMKLSF